MMHRNLNFVFAFVILNYVVSADYRAHELIMNVLSQFLSKNSYETQTTTTPSSILPAILNPLHWIPNFADIPWNPDAELTTVTNLTQLHIIEQIHQLITELKC